MNDIAKKVIELIDKYAVVKLRYQKRILWSGKTLIANYVSED